VTRDELSVTHGEALRRAIDELRATSESPRADAYRLLEDVLDRNPSWLIANEHETLTESACHRFVGTVERRRGGEPIAYITGQSGFFGATYDVNRDVLVPRPETEHLVEAALEFLLRLIAGGKSALKILDVGTGSGAIACAVTRTLPGVTADAIDVCASAIAMAEQNAARLGVRERCRFLVGDLTGPVKSERYSCIVANLPYIPTAQLPRPPSPLAFEPRTALDGGTDGLDVYRRLLPQLNDLLEPDALVLLEGAPPTIDQLLALARKYFPRARLSVHRDHANIDRFVSIATGSASSRAE